MARLENDGVRYELRTLFREAATLAGVAADGSVVLAEIPVIPTGSPAFCYTCPGSMPASISEIMVNDSTLADEVGEPEPWIEIFNPSAEAVDLTGWTLSNDFTRRNAWTFPAISIPRHETLVVFADGDVDQGPLHTSFTLAPESGEIILTMPDGVTDGGFVYGASGADHSIVYDWAVGGYVVTNNPTPRLGPSD